LHDFEKEGLVTTDQREFGRRRGRPEMILWLPEHRADVLKKNALLGSELLYEKLTAENIQCPDHQLVLNWFRIHLAQTERIHFRLSVTFHVYNSPFLPHDRKGRSIITNYAPVEGNDDKRIKFVVNVRVKTGR